MKAVRLSAGIDLKSRWQDILDRWQECKTMWDAEVKQLIDKRFKELKQNEEEQLQLQKEYQMQLDDWKKEIDDQESFLTIWTDEIKAIRDDLENDLFHLPRPSQAPYAEEIVAEFNDLQCAVKCRKLGRLHVAHNLSSCPFRLSPPLLQKQGWDLIDKIAFVGLDISPADYTEVKAKINRMFVEITANQPRRKPSPPIGLRSYEIPEDCLKQDQKAFDAPGSSNVHQGELALTDSKSMLEIHKLMWMGCIDRIVDGTSAFTNEDLAILENQHGACKYFNLAYVEKMAFDRSNIHRKLIKDVMTPPMLNLLKELHDELTRFEQVKDRTRRLMLQVRVCL